MDCYMTAIAYLHCENCGNSNPDLFEPAPFRFTGEEWFYCSNCTCTAILKLGEPELVDFIQLFDISQAIEEHLQKNTHHYWHKAGYRLATHDEVIRAILSDQLLCKGDLTMTLDQIHQAVTNAKSLQETINALGAGPPPSPIALVDQYEQTIVELQTRIAVLEQQLAAEEDHNADLLTRLEGNLEQMAELRWHKRLDKLQEGTIENQHEALKAVCRSRDDARRWAALWKERAKYYRAKVQEECMPDD